MTIQAEIQSYTVQTLDGHCQSVKSSNSQQNNKTASETLPNALLEQKVDKSLGTKFVRGDVV